MNRKQVRDKTRKFMSDNAKAGQFFILFYVLLFVFCFFFSVLYSLLNPFFFILLLTSSLALVHFVLYMFLVIFNDLPFYNYWRNTEDRKIILSAKLRMMIRYAIPLYIINIGFFVIFYVSGRITTPYIDLQLPQTEVILIIAQFVIGYISSLILVKWIVAKFVSFDSYNPDVGLIGGNMKSIIKGFVFLILWWLPLFSLALYYIAIYEEEVSGDPGIILAAILILNVLPLVVSQVPQLQPNYEREVIDAQLLKLINS